MLKKKTKWRDSFSCIQLRVKKFMKVIKYKKMRHEGAGEKDVNSKNLKRVAAT